MAHHKNQHGVEKGGSGQEGNKEGGGNKPKTFRMAFIAISRLMPCPVKGFSVRAMTWSSMQVSFWHRHVRDTVVILEDRNLPHPRCHMCEILVPWRLLNKMHRRTS